MLNLGLVTDELDAVGALEMLSEFYVWGSLPG